MRSANDATVWYGGDPSLASVKDDAACSHPMDFSGASRRKWVAMAARPRRFWNGPKADGVWRTTAAEPGESVAA